MHFIVVKYQVKPESADAFPDIVSEFTDRTRSEPGNLWFEWSRSIEDPNEYVLVEAFTTKGAAEHVSAPHFQAGLDAMRPHLSTTPKIISREIEGQGWDRMGELEID